MTLNIDSLVEISEWLNEPEYSNFRIINKSIKSFTYKRNPNFKKPKHILYFWLSTLIEFIEISDNDSINGATTIQLCKADREIILQYCINNNKPIIIFSTRNPNTYEEIDITDFYNKDVINKINKTIDSKLELLSILEIDEAVAAYLSFRIYNVITSLNAKNIYPTKKIITLLPAKIFDSEQIYDKYCNYICKLNAIAFKLEK